MEEHNNIMLMTLPSRIESPEAQEYLRLRQTEELKKLWRRLAEEERPEQHEENERIHRRKLARATWEEANAEARRQMGSAVDGAGNHELRAMRIGTASNLTSVTMVSSHIAKNRSGSNIGVQGPAGVIPEV